MSAAMSPYSIAVAPRLSAPSLRKIVRIAITPPSSGPRPQGWFSGCGVNNSYRAISLTAASMLAGVQAAKWRISNVSTVRRPSPRAERMLCGRGGRASRSGARTSQKDVGAPMARKSRPRSRATNRRPATRSTSTTGWMKPAAESSGRAPTARSAGWTWGDATPWTASAARIAARSWGRVSPPDSAPMNKASGAMARRDRAAARAAGR